MSAVLLLLGAVPLIADRRIWASPPKEVDVVGAALLWSSGVGWVLTAGQVTVE